MISLTRLRLMIDDAIDDCGQWTASLRRRPHAHTGADHILSVLGQRRRAVAIGVSSQSAKWRNSESSGAAELDPAGQTWT